MIRAEHLQILFLPLAAVMTFLISSVALFYLGPFQWPIRNPDTLYLFLAAVMIATAGGFTLGVTGRAQLGTLQSWRRVFIFGALSSCVMIFPSAFVYTGKMPWDALSALRDQGQAYRDFLDRVAELEGTRGPIVMVRALVHWASYAVIPFAILNWRQLNFSFLLLLVGAVLSNMVFSLLRGTDQGTFDLIYITGISSLVAICRYSISSKKSFIGFLNSRAGAFLSLVGIALVCAGLFMFSERKTARYEGQIDLVCFGEEMQACANWNHQLAALMSEQGRFTFAMVTGYASAGYYGLALSLDREFSSTYGLGHSPALMRVYEAVTGDKELYKQSFTYRLRQDAWSDEYLWSSMYTWIANDVGFLLTIPIVGLLAALWGAAWRDAIKGRNDAAAIVFCLLTQTFMYTPANFQLGLGLDTYATLLVWTLIWQMSSRRRRHGNPQ